MARSKPDSEFRVQSSALGTELGSFQAGFLGIPLEFFSSQKEGLSDFAAKPIECRLRWVGERGSCALRGLRTRGMTQVILALGNLGGKFVCPVPLDPLLRRISDLHPFASLLREPRNTLDPTFLSCRCAASTCPFVFFLPARHADDF